MVGHMPQHIPGGGVDLSHLAHAAQSQGAAAAPGQAPAAPAQATGPSGGQVVDVPSIELDVTDQTFE